MFPTLTIPKLHLEYGSWMNELNFYKDEIIIFEKHLEEIISQPTDLETRVQVEHFQNQFIRQKVIIDDLKHLLQVSERQLAAYVKKLSGMGLESIRMDNHTRLRDDMKIFREIYTELKKEFRRFEADCLSTATVL